MKKKLNEMQQYVCGNLCSYAGQIKDVGLLEEVCAECMFEGYVQEIESKIPKKKEDNSVIHLERYEGYLEGWNDCVNEILGGAENG